MRSLVILGLHDTHIIDLIYPDLSRSMDDLMGIQQDTYVCDPPLFIVKESQVPRFCLFQEADRLTLAGLLPRVPRHLYSQELIDRLYKPAAVQTKDRFSAPEIRCVQEFVGQLPDGLGIDGS